MEIAVDSAATEVAPATAFFMKFLLCITEVFLGELKSLIKLD
jgi:hypothetical protein